MSIGTKELVQCPEGVCVAFSMESFGIDFPCEVVEKFAIGLPKPGELSSVERNDQSGGGVLFFLFGKDVAGWKGCC